MKKKQMIFAGDQNSGMTTKLRESVAFIEARAQVRVIEEAYELPLNDAYPEKNIVAVHVSKDCK